MKKVQFDPKLYALPTSQLILGTMYKDKPNFMALAWATRVNFKPPLIAIGVNKNNISHDALIETAQFSLCMPSTELVSMTDYVGIVSARKTDKSNLFDVFYGELEGAPLIQECPLCLELSLYKTVDLPTNSVFIGEIVGSWCDEHCLVDGAPDVATIQPFVLTMPDNRYWQLGDIVGKAWNAGKTIKQSRTTE